MLAHSLGERTENNPEVAEFLSKRSGNGDAVEHRVHGNSAENLSLLKRYAKLLVSPQQLRIDLV